MRPRTDTIRPYVIHVNKNITFLKHAGVIIIKSLKPFPDKLEKLSELD